MRLFQPFYLVIFVGLMGCDPTSPPGADDGNNTLPISPGECFSEDDCEPGEACVENACEVVPSPAAIDSGTPPIEAPDSGSAQPPIDVVDAGSETGSEDPVDAGGSSPSEDNTDAGQSSSNNSGTSDAGSSGSSASTDAGPDLPPSFCSDQADGTACDDENLCTREDTCEEGVCVGIANTRESFTCDGLNEDCDEHTDEDCTFQVNGNVLGAGKQVSTDGAGFQLRTIVGSQHFLGQSSDANFSIRATSLREYQAGVSHEAP